MGTLKSLLLLIVLATSTVSFSNDIVLISDLDDTIKITETNRPLMTIYRGLFSKKVFAGMPELYEHMQHLYVDKTVILSNSPKVLKGPVNRLIKKHNIEVDQLILRSLKTDKDKFKYKFNNIVAQLSGNAKKAILIGDDSGEDHEIYTAVKAAHPDRVLAIYIRPVKGRHLPAGINKYITAFDIALNEYNAGRLGYTELRDIADLVANHRKEREVIAKKSYCPKSGRISFEGVEELVAAVQHKVIAICKDRKIK
jgi:phosphatidate phosphatase APP1